MSAIKISDQLLAEAKHYLDITWEDELADAKLRGQLRRGIAYISAKTGVEASAFAGDQVDGRAQELLFNYVLYDRSGAVHQFKQNYRSDIIATNRYGKVYRGTSNYTSDILFTIDGVLPLPEFVAVWYAVAGTL